MFPGKCAFQCILMITDVLRECIPEVNPRMNLEVQKLKASANPAVPTIVPYCCTIGWAELFIIFISVKNSNNWTVYRFCSTRALNLVQPCCIFPQDYKLVLTFRTMKLLSSAFLCNFLGTSFFRDDS